MKPKIRIIDGQIIGRNGTPILPIAHPEPEPEIPEIDLTEFADQGTAQALADLLTDLTTAEEITDDLLDLTTLEDPTPDPHADPEGRSNFPQIIEDANPNEFRQVDGILVPNDQAIELQLTNPPALLPVICPYLTNGVTGDSDLGLYLHYLISGGKTKKTVSEYGMNLRRWKQFLNGEITVDRINAALQAFNAFRRYTMFMVLRSYAKYRSFHEDHKLLVLLTTSLAFQKPKDPRGGLTPRRPNDTITTDEARTYFDLAKRLCKEGNREGIWMALLLKGVSVSDIADVEIKNKSTISFRQRGNPTEAKIALWLWSALTSIAHWRQKRKWILMNLSEKYAVTPRALNRGAKLLKPAERNNP